MCSFRSGTVAAIGQDIITATVRYVEFATLDAATSTRRQEKLKQCKLFKRIARCRSKSDCADDSTAGSSTGRSGKDKWQWMASGPDRVAICSLEREQRGLAGQR